ncbi:MAG: hypothetical protein EOM06_12370 [Sphingobacteriia bacterium]|nr:hypothetical protein [Sphingobacteriia bacterium]
MEQKRIYNLSQFMAEVKGTSNYKLAFSIIQQNGCMTFNHDGQPFEVYSPALAAWFMKPDSDKIPLIQSFSHEFLRGSQDIEKMYIDRIRDKNYWLAKLERLLKEPNTPVIGTVESFGRLGYIAGQISILQFWQAEYITKEPEKPAITLETLFKKNDLVKLVLLLKEHGFVDANTKWQGIRHETATGKGLQLVALAVVCSDMYRRKVDNKQLWQAWTTYFGYEMKYTTWTPGKIEQMYDEYFRLFNFVKHSFRLS